ncbi:Uma2 family endonuclease [Kitasatospora sp. NPDC089913]|uniref:Uma2 family endonuclease n=1 Tax=Kitasatospora sp. NPDC089913 TaxID=3364080 RepID=UPI003823449D
MDTDRRLWDAWASLEVPEHFRTEIKDGVLMVSHVGGPRHRRIGTRLLDALAEHLGGSGWWPADAGHVLHGHEVSAPDVLVVPEDIDAIAGPEDLGVLASGVALVVETVSPDSEHRHRDLVDKPRAYATAGIPVYVIIDDYDYGGGAVTVLSGPDPERGAYARSERTPYGEDAVIPEGPAKGFAIGPGITGERRG